VTRNEYVRLHEVTVHTGPRRANGGDRIDSDDDVGGVEFPRFWHWVATKVGLLL